MRLTPEQIDGWKEYGRKCRVNQEEPLISETLFYNLLDTIEDLRAELDRVRQREQAMEAAAYRKAAAHIENFVDGYATFKGSAAGIRALISSSAQSALDAHDDEVIAQYISKEPMPYSLQTIVDAHIKRARETALRRREALQQVMKSEADELASLLDTPGSPSQQKGQTAERVEIWMEIVEDVIAKALADESAEFFARLRKSGIRATEL